MINWTIEKAKRLTELVCDVNKHSESQIAKIMTEEFGEDFTRDSVHNKILRLNVRSLLERKIPDRMPYYAKYKDIIEGTVNAPDKIVDFAPNGMYLEIPKSNLKILHLGDLHIPFQNDEQIQTAINRNALSDVVVTTEVMDCYSLSRFNKNLSVPFEVEIDNTVRYFETLSENFPLTVAKGGNHECFDDVTEVLTKRGWVLFKDVIEKDFIYTYNSVTRVMEYQHPTHIQKYLYDGKMMYYNKKRGAVSLNVTPNHELLYRENFRCGDTKKVCAREFPSKEVQILLSGSLGDSESSVSGAEAGWYLTDGGDGSRANGKTKTHYFNPSGVVYGEKKFLDDLQIACLLHGFRATITEYRPNNFRLNVRRGNNHGLYWGRTKIKFEERDYSGFVYCVTVPNGSIMIRRDGKPCVTGNSRVVKTFLKSVPPSLLWMVKESILTLLARPFPNIIVSETPVLQINDAIFTHAEIYSKVDLKAAMNVRGFLEEWKETLNLRDFHLLVDSHTHMLGATYRSNLKIMESGCVCKIPDYSVMGFYYKPQNNGYIVIVQKGGVTDLNLTREYIFPPEKYLPEQRGIRFEL